MSDTQIVLPDESAFLRFAQHLLEISAEGKRWPPTVFEVILKLLAHTSWEIVPVITHRGKKQFLYIRRSPNDLAYPPDPMFGSPWCFAGSNNRGEPLAAGLARINAEHFRVGEASRPRLVGGVNWYKEPRGPGVGLVFLCDYRGAIPPDAQWYDWDCPPDHMIEIHRFIATCLFMALQDHNSTPFFMDDPR